MPKVRASGFSRLLLGNWFRASSTDGPTGRARSCEAVPLEPITAHPPRSGRVSRDVLRMGVPGSAGALRVSNGRSMLSGCGSAVGPAALLVQPELCTPRNLHGMKGGV